MAGPQLEQLRTQSDERANEFSPFRLPPPEGSSVELLNRLVSDGWLIRKERHTCPHCGEELTDDEVAVPICPHCSSVYSEFGGITTEAVFLRHLRPIRSVEWVVAIHGMNTSGAWQEEFSWMLSTTWGRSVPVVVYKYGIIIAGVILAWRRERLKINLRNKLRVLRDQARAHGYEGNPDVIAHSFGTWLLGHLLMDELTRPPSERLSFGRIILTGCVLRPDFDWKALKDARVVADVLNHYGTADRVVPLANATIWDSGPSGCRGFDGDQVLNVEAPGFGHSDLFSTEKRTSSGTSYLASSYQEYWRPFLRLPREELVDLPNQLNPKDSWHSLPWPLRGTVFPFVALPLIGTILGFFLGGVGRILWEWHGGIETIAVFIAICSTLLALSIALVLLKRRLWH
jgi:hypothetical protein